MSPRRRLQIIQQKAEIDIGFKWLFTDNYENFNKFSRSKKLLNKASDLKLFSSILGKKKNYSMKIKLTTEIQNYQRFQNFILKIYQPQIKETTVKEATMKQYRLSEFIIFVAQHKEKETRVK